MALKHHLIFDLPRAKIAVVNGPNTFILNPKFAKLFKKWRGSLLVEGYSQSDTEIPRKVRELFTDLDLFLTPTDPTSPISKQHAIAVVQSAINMWKPLLAMHPLSEKVSKSSYSQISYLVEVTWFTSMAKVYLSAGAQAAKSNHLKKAMNHLLQAEKDHYRPLIASLGITEELLETHDGCPATLLLTSYLHFLASTDPESFLISTALFETQKKDLPHIRQKFTKIAKNTGLNLKPFIEHHSEDIKAGHAALWRETILNSKKLDKDRLSKWVADLHKTKHAIELWYDSLIIWTRPSTSIRPLKPSLKHPCLHIRPAPNGDSISVR